RAVVGARAVVNLVGILAKSGAQSFEAVHVAGARAIARAAKAAGATTLVHVSALGVDRNSKSSYARTKAAGEAAVLEEFPAAIVLRPRWCSVRRTNSSIVLRRWRALLRCCRSSAEARRNSSPSMSATSRRRLRQRAR